MKQIRLRRPEYTRPDQGDQNGPSNLVMQSLWASGCHGEMLGWRLMFWNEGVASMNGGLKNVYVLAALGNGLDSVLMATTEP